MPAGRRVLVGLRVARATAWLRGRGAQVGHGPAIIGKLPLVNASGRIVIGERLQMKARQFRCELSAADGGELVLGSNVYVNQGVNIYAAQSVHIGDDVRIGDLCAIYDTDFHEVDEGDAVRVAPVEIGDNVWLGRSVVVLPGATIGRNSVIAAGSVVTGDIAANSLAAGNPAKVRRALTASEGWVRH